MIVELQSVSLGELVDNFDSRRRPVKSSERTAGPYPYYGASGVVDHVADFIFDGEYLLVSEDGENLRSRAQPIAFVVDGKFWPNNHAHVLRGRERFDTRFLSYLLATTDITGYLTGSAQPKLTRGSMDSIMLSVPPPRDRQAIAEVLGALDDKIAANTKLASKVDSLSTLIFEAKSAETEGDASLGDVATLVLGGTPSRSRGDYWAEGTIAWLASGKANESRVFAPTAFITEEAYRASATKMMPRGATVLAITGATLGQIARLEIEACGNQSLVGIWGDGPELTDWLHFAVRSRVGVLLQGATGAAQQHVNKNDVAALRVPLIPRRELLAWAAQVSPLLAVASMAGEENRSLAATRDTLLPQLMSGKLRVKEAERIVSEVA
ncbi:restriction endonuclease subunit S [Oerskovia sp. Sa1BUA8]|uniref:Restriction endonuclease subunit S n=1 Tax=Oerskovia douganii TaxID=2762210 RepID=A0A9D5U8U4_9CELL|nr:restriction endonuclease subunit S [Oerskovia douganii]MBE7700288.1 restriction endonuclease subunit S [Oerskovia douganii]